MYRGQDNRGRVRLVEMGEKDVSDDRPHDATETWTRVKRRLRAELGEDVFASWFARLEMDSIADGCAKLSVPTRFLKSWIEAHYVDRVLSVYRSEAPGVERVNIGVRGTPVREPARSPKPNGEGPRLVSPMAHETAIVYQSEHRAPRDERPDAGEVTGAPLDPRLTFESFVLGRSNALAHAAGDRVAQHQGSPPTLRRVTTSGVVTSIPTTCTVAEFRGIAVRGSVAYVVIGSVAVVVAIQLP